MEIKELLEIMLNNVNEGRDAAHGLIGYNGVVNVLQPELVYRKPHTYITFDEFREIRNTNDHNTSLNRLNLAIEKLMVVTPVAPVQPVLPPVVMPFVVPQGYTWAKAPPEFYGKYRSDGWTDEQLISDGYLIPMAPYEPDRAFKPFVDWVCGGCNHVWPRRDYIFTESQFSNFKDSEFRVRLVAALNLRIEDCKSFNSVVSNLSIGETFESIKSREERVNKRLNEIYQKL